MDGSSALKVFEFEEKQVRIVMVDDEPWLVAKDVAEVIGAVWEGAKSIGAVPEEWKGVLPVYTPGGMQQTQCLTEQGLYFFLARSDKPAALPFQKKVAGEILPSIRKHGAYMTPETIEKALTSPDFIIRLATALKEEQEKARSLSATIDANQPLVLFAQSVQTSADSILIGELATLLRQNGIDIGQNRLFVWMRENGYLLKLGSWKNMPTQKAMDAGLFEVKIGTRINPDGETREIKTPKVTGRGQIYFVNLFLGEPGRNKRKTA